MNITAILAPGSPNPHRPHSPPSLTGNHSSPSTASHNEDLRPPPPHPLQHPRCPPRRRHEPHRGPNPHICRVNHPHQTLASSPTRSRAAHPLAPRTTKSLQARCAPHLQSTAAQGIRTCSLRSNTRAATGPEGTTPKGAQARTSRHHYPRPYTIRIPLGDDRANCGADAASGHLFPAVSAGAPMVAGQVQVD